MSLLELERGIYQRLAEQPHLAEDPAVKEGLRELEAAKAANPLQFFEPHSAPQLRFFQARTKLVAAFAGNRFGKTTALTVRALIEALPREVLPAHLARYKRFDGPTAGWILCPTNEKIYDTFKPTLEKWVPKSELRGGRWDKAWNGERDQLTFANHSTVSFKTYKQDHSTLGGAALHYAGYDEPPPRKHRSEVAMRLVDYQGYEMFAMTPLEVNTGWVRREIWRKREDPDITVVKAAIHDNPFLDRVAIEKALSVHPEHERKAREFGDFLDFGGLIYPDFDRCVAEEPFDLDFIRTLDVVVGIDPGIRNAGLVWVGFDRDLAAYVFNEALLQDKEAKDYAAVIHAENNRLGLKDVHYVADPMQRERGKVDSTTVKTALTQHGIYANDGQNNVPAGLDQMRTRMRHRRFQVDPRCLRLRDEADDYAAKEPGESDDDSHLVPIKGNDHLLDACRYAVMERFWDPIMEDQAPNRVLGWQPGRAPALHEMTVPSEVSPMGSMS